MLINFSGYAQDDFKVIPPSSNAATLGLYGQIPVSLFSGLPQISIPIGKIITGDEDLNVDITYHGGGVRVDQHPGWIGLGFNINAGGAIIRKVNGEPDECVVPLADPETASSYYNNYSLLSGSNWVDLLPTLATYENRPYTTIPAPDEFMFSFGKYSGSFFYDHTGKWQVRSDEPLTLKITEELMSDFHLTPLVISGPVLREDIILKRIFYKFTLITPDGTQYIFGGAPESIEFTRGTVVFNAYNSNVIPTSWSLKKVITNRGQETIFSYDKGDIIAPISNSFSTSDAEVSTIHDRTGGTSVIMSVINPVYLRQIETADQRIVFSRSSTNELRYDYYQITSEQQLSVLEFKDLRAKNFNALVTNAKWQKLDSISFYSKQSGFLKKISFSYLNTSSSRLMLQSIQEFGSDGTGKSPYKFGYHNGVLPGYNSRRTDHWGFYNGRDYLGDLPVYSNPQDNIYKKEFVAPYTASKASDLMLMQGGNLVSITYPTGGSTSFEYEPHEYSKIAKRYPFTTANVANSLCGGLRIKNVTLPKNRTV